MFARGTVNSGFASVYVWWIALPFLRERIASSRLEQQVSLQVALATFQYSSQTTKLSGYGSMALWHCKVFFSWDPSEKVGMGSVLLCPFRSVLHIAELWHGVAS